MSTRIGSPLIVGATTIGVTGLGVKGIDLPSTGEDGIAPLFQLANLPAENDVEFRWLILTTPSVGTFFAYEDGSFEWDAPLETVDSFTFEWFKDGVSQGNDTVNVTITEDTGLNITTTEIRSSRIDDSFLSIATPGSAEFVTTEVRSSRLNSSILSIPQNLLLSVTETRSARFDISAVNVPVVITVNPKNIIRVKRKNNIIRVR